MIAVLVGLVLVAINGVFVATEFALLASRAAKLEAAADRGNRRARLALRSIRRLPLQLAGAQLGITMTSLGLGFVAEPALDAGVHSLLSTVGVPSGVTRALSVVLSLMIVVTVHAVFGEAVPKNIAIAAPERTLVALIAPFGLYLKVFGRLIRALNGAAGLGVKLLGVEPRTDLDRVHSPEEIAAMVQESGKEGLIEEFEQSLLAGVLGFRSSHVEQLMTSWPDVKTVRPQDTVEDLERMVLSSGHTRLPVVSGSAGLGVRGFVHAKDLLTVGADGRGLPLPVTAVRHFLRASPESQAKDLLGRMRSSHIHLAVVFNGVNEPIGLVTLEDLLEELVGDIRDESDLPGASVSLPQQPGVTFP